MKYLPYIIYVIYAFLIISLLYIASSPKTVVAQPIVEVVYVGYSYGDVIKESVIEDIISRYATGTKAYQMKRTLYCESQYHNIKSYLPEESYGVAQIHLPSHPDITKPQALDPEFSIKWMAENWNTKWYGYSRLQDKCN